MGYSMTMPFISQRIAVFSDTHGNLTALQAMYRDSIAQHVDEYWFIGDLLMPGPLKPCVHHSHTAKDRDEHEHKWPHQLVRQRR